MNTSALAEQRPAWQKRLNLVVGDLEAALQAPPADGNEIESLKQISNENIADAHVALEAVEVEQGLNLESFGSFHKRLSNSVNDTLSDITGSLDTLRYKIEDLLELKTTLEEVSYSIKNVSLLMKIKTTKMGKSEFDHVVRGLESLAGQIKENTEGITLSATVAAEGIMQTCDEVNERLDRFNRLYKPSREQVDKLLEIVEAMSAETVKRCKRVDALSEQAGRVIDSLIADGELKPKYRDRLQEAHDALQEISATLEEAGNDDNFRSLADSIARQIDQLAQWEMELESVDDRIRKNMEQLQEILAEQDDTAGLLAESFMRLKEKINIFEEDFSGISSTLTFSEEKTRDFLEAISGINENVTSVSNQVSQIDIGRTDLEALTYNAVFKAAKVGMQGKVMESITDEITGLSREMQSKVTDKEAVIKSVLDTSKEFKSSLSEKLNRQLEVSNEMNLRIQEQCRKFYDEIDRILSLPRNITRLKEAVNSAFRNEIDAQDVAGQMQKVQMGLADILHDITDQL